MFASAGEFQRMLCEQFVQLYEEGQDSGRVGHSEMVDLMLNEEGCLTMTCS